MKKIFRLMLPLLVLCLFITTPSYAATKKTQKITVKQVEYTKTYGDAAFRLGAKAKTKLSYTSSNKKVATVDKKGEVTIKNGGDVTITIKAAATKTYKAATEKVFIYVRPKSSREAVASIVLTDGTVIKADSGVKVPASKISGAKVKFDGMADGEVFRTDMFPSHGEYWVSEDPDAAWGGIGIYYTPAGKKQAEKLAKENGWDLEESVALTTVDSYVARYFQSSGYWYEGEWKEVSDWVKPTHLYVSIAPMQIKDITGKYRYENNFEIDLDK